MEINENNKKNNESIQQNETKEEIKYGESEIKDNESIEELSKDLINEIFGFCDEEEKKRKII